MFKSANTKLSIWTSMIWLKNNKKLERELFDKYLEKFGFDLAYILHFLSDKTAFMKDLP